MVPAYSLPQALSFRDALALGAKKAPTAVALSLDDTAVLQYTGGTTGVSKGAQLLQKNLVSNMMQVRELIVNILDTDTEVVIAPLPLYHIYAFTVSLVMSDMGHELVLIPNPRDIPGFVKELSRHKFTSFIGLNTLFVALCNNKDFTELDFSHLKHTLSGGMALTEAAAATWKKVTACEVQEAYGLTETSPAVSFNPYHDIRLGTIGKALPGTQVKVIGADGSDLGFNQEGELCVKGPQVMAGYWQLPEATAAVLGADGWLKTGDVAILAEDGFIRLVDRIKDMINVSGFNVYPNEIDDIASQHPGILECAAVGIPNEVSGETVKLFVVKLDPNLTEADVLAHCRENLTGYKVPKEIEFKNELPKTNVGKILRRALRD
jgi:long-chain acyl-CoA synthetase